MKTFTLNLETGNDFCQAWILDAICNSAWKGVQTNTTKAADLLGEATEVLTESSDPDSDVSQNQLDRLRTRIEMHDEQRTFFQMQHDDAVKAWKKVTGKHKWVAYSSKQIQRRSATDTNAFFAKRAKG